MKRKILLLGLVIATLLIAITFANEWTLISNIYTAEPTKVVDPHLHTRSNKTWMDVHFP